MAEGGFKDVELECEELEDREGEAVEEMVEDFDEEAESPQEDDNDDVELS